MTILHAPECPICGQLLSLEASTCPGCGNPVGFVPATGTFLAAPSGGRWRDAAGNEPGLIECHNRALEVCNWLFEPADGRTLCDACRHNRTIPDLGQPGVLARWRKVEVAKKRCIDPLIRLGIPPAVSEPNCFGLAFDILYDPAAEQGGTPELLTAHEAGLVTINLIEADDAARERARLNFGESYRTLVGHFRHEVGHYYWYRLVENTPDLEPFRARFGDERLDYGEALNSYYARGDSDSWQGEFVSRYATMHPWEDFAETFAHYLHIVDTLATAAGFGLSVAPRGARTTVDFDPYSADTATLVEAWIPVAFALNATNRSMGQPDLYPFSMTPQIVAKIDFINRLLAFGAGRWTPGEAEQAGLKAMLATLGHGVELDGTR